jgi:hypothetical protein
MFVVVVERIAHPSVVGPFPHEEDANQWAEDHLARPQHIVPHVWRVAPLVAPTEYVDS